MNKGEFGNNFFGNVGFDISAATNIKLMFKAECFTDIKTAADGVVVPNIDAVSADKTYLANQYVKYQFKAGDVAVGGIWRAYVEFDLNGKRRMSEVGLFEIGERCF